MADVWIGRPGDFDPELSLRWERVRAEVERRGVDAVGALWCPFCRAQRAAKRIVVIGTRGIFHEVPAPGDLACNEWTRVDNSSDFYDALRRRIAG